MQRRGIVEAGLQQRRRIAVLDVAPVRAERLAAGARFGTCLEHALELARDLVAVMVQIVLQRVPVRIAQAVRQPRTIQR